MIAKDGFENYLLSVGKFAISFVLTVQKHFFVCVVGFSLLGLRNFFIKSSILFEHIFQTKSSASTISIVSDSLQSMAQSDFGLLAVNSANEDLTNHKHSQKFPGPNSESLKTINSFPPMDFNTDIVTTIMMIVAWGQPNLPKLEPQDKMDDSGSLDMAESMTGMFYSADIATMTRSLELYEPLRLCSFAAQPKSFYRRFWRSVARRLLERQT